MVGMVSGTKARYSSPRRSYRPSNTRSAATRTAGTSSRQAPRICVLAKLFKATRYLTKRQKQKRKTADVNYLAIESAPEGIAAGHGGQLQQAQPQRAAGALSMAGGSLAVLQRQLAHKGLARLEALLS